ncbi:unnamed protein product [Clonostachys rosea f. rosea IK726]|uniref:Uncharacterized protein n=1 Tax=Clonostachys rosea f. rosea IK726 TaxID=1349383 RepID=A0ACA9UCN3_BIOOC|nr:unnamed protein product [Clonostachys rosea f. rosea IK726]
MVGFKQISLTIAVALGTLPVFCRYHESQGLTRRDESYGPAVFARRDAIFAKAQDELFAREIGEYGDHPALEARNRHSNGDPRRTGPKPNPPPKLVHQDADVGQKKDKKRRSLQRRNSGNSRRTGPKPNPPPKLVHQDADVGQKKDKKRRSLQRRNSGNSRRTGPKPNPPPKLVHQDADVGQKKDKKRRSLQRRNSGNSRRTGPKPNPPPKLVHQDADVGQKKKQ